MGDIKKIKILSILVAVLVLLNVALLAYMWFAPHPMMHGVRPPHHGPAGLVEQDLKFDDVQKERFEMMKHGHHESMMRLDDTERELHKLLYQKLIESLPVASVDTIIVQISALQRLRDSITYSHLIEVRQLCKPDQQKIFDEMLKRPMSSKPDRPPRD